MPSGDCKDFHILGVKLFKLGNDNKAEKRVESEQIHLQK